MKNGRQAGFSLIEILVAGVMFGSVTAVVCYFLRSQNDMSARNAESLQSLNLGKLKLDSFKVAEYGRLESGSDTVDSKFIRSWHVSPLTDAGGFPNGRKKIEVTVFWPLSADQRLTLTSLRSDGKYKE